MKLGLISDTHDRQAGIDGAFRRFTAAGVTAVIHCGDWTKPETVRYLDEKAQAAGIVVHGVLGNNDRDVGAMLALNDTLRQTELHDGVLRITLAGRTVIAYHGHHKPTLRAVLSERCDLLCLGHSHKPRYDRIVTDASEKIILNPGSTAFAIPRSKSWQASVAIYDSVAHVADFQYFDARRRAARTGSVACPRT